MSPFNVIQSDNISDSLTRCWRALRNDDIQFLNHCVIMIYMVEGFSVVDE